MDKCELTTLFAYVRTLTCCPARAGTPEQIRKMQEGGNGEHDWKIDIEHLIKQSHNGLVLRSS